MLTKYKIIGTIVVALFLAGCASTRPEMKLMPKESDYVYPFFVRGQPIAAVRSKDAFILLSINRTIVADVPYFQLWMLYQNASETPYLLEPLKFASMDITSMEKEEVRSSNPESPTKILAKISNEKALSMIMQAIGGAFEEMAVRATSATTRFKNGSSITTTLNDQQEKRNIAADRIAWEMANTAAWYDIYQSSMSDGILRRNTIFPGQSVNGYIYFPIPTIEKRGYRRDIDILPKVRQFLTIHLELSGENLDVYFTPIAGE